MSTTNRAFIKAYRQDAAEAAPIGGNSPAMIGENRTIARESAIRSGASVGTLAQPSVAHQPSASKRPLSSFMGRSQAIERPAEKADANFLQPGTTVASFQWPRICRTLSQQCGPQLDRVVDLLRAQADAGYSLIGVMGLFPRVGATTVALCLASRLARRVRRAMLVDANFCHPRIAAWLDAVPTVGWEEVLGHAGPLADAVIRATDDKLDLLALGPKAIKNPEPLASGLQAAVSAGVLRHAYDLVVVDLGTFFDQAAQPIVLDLVRNLGIDSVIGVSGPDSADPRDLATIAEYFQPSGCQLLGTIENRVATPAAA